MNTTSPSLLMRLRRPGESLSWRQFADVYTPLFYYWAKRLGLQESDAADLVQDVMALLVRKLPEFQYDRSRSFRGWLHTTLINQWRMNKRRNLPNQASEEELGRLQAPEETDSLSEVEYRRYLTERAMQLMKAQFQPTTWQACWLQVVEGRSGAEVAAELGISEGAAYVARCRVIRRLREEMEGLLD